jgi:carboxypeptidase T
MMCRTLFALLSLLFVDSAISDIEGSVGGYLSYMDVLGMIQMLELTYPDIVSSGSIGKSTQDREIPYLKLSIPSNLSSDGVSNKGNLLISAGMYTAQPLAISQALYNVQFLLQDLDTVDMRMLLKKTDIWVIPMINVDSFEVFAFHYESDEEFLALNKNQQKTCDRADHLNGINLNRNFGVNWEEDLEASKNGCDKNYKGASPFSASETAAIRDFVEEKDIHIWIDYDG